MYLIDSDNITSDDFLLLDSFDHLLAEIVDGFHFSSLKGDLTSSSSTALFYNQTS